MSRPLGAGVYWGCCSTLGNLSWGAQHPLEFLMNKKKHECNLCCSKGICKFDVKTFLCEQQPYLEVVMTFYFLLVIHVFLFLLISKGVDCGSPNI